MFRVICTINSGILSDPSRLFKTCAVAPLQLSLMAPEFQGACNPGNGRLPSLPLMMKLDYSKKPSLTQLLLSIFSPMPRGLPGQVTLMGSSG